MKGTPLFDEMTPPDQSRRWWLFPIFWALVFCIGLALSTLTLAQNHPEHLAGWAGVRLAALLLGNFAAYMLVAWGWLYREQPPAAWCGPLFFAAQILLLLLLIGWYGAAFAWICLALLYPVIGGLPMRQWPLPLAALLLVFVLGSLLWNGGAGASAASSAAKYSSSSRCRNI